MLLRYLKSLIYNSVAELRVKVQFVDGGINVLGARNHTLAVYTIDGKLAYQSKVNTDELRVSLAPGVYIVRVGNRASKVVIK